jgi:hypothetical protein
MHPDLSQSLVNERIAELRGTRNRRLVARPRSRRSRGWLTSGRARVGQLFVRVGTSLIGDGAGYSSRHLQQPVRQPSRTEPACSVR